MGCSASVFTVKYCGSIVESAINDPTRATETQRRQIVCLKLFNMIYHIQFAVLPHTTIMCVVFSVEE